MAAHEPKRGAGGDRMDNGRVRISNIPINRATSKWASLRDFIMVKLLRNKRATAKYYITKGLEKSYSYFKQSN
jgi:hypothetical protein